MFRTEYLRHGQCKSAEFNRLDMAQRLAQTWSGMADDGAAHVFRTETGLCVFTASNCSPIPARPLAVVVH